MIKKLTVLTPVLVLIVLLALLAGCGAMAPLLTEDCGEGIFHVTLNQNGSADLQCRIGLNNNLMVLASTEKDDPFNELRRTVESKGFRVANYNENQKTGIIAKKHFNSINDIPDFTQLAGFLLDEKPTLPETKKGLVIDNGFLKTHYKLDTKIDIGNSDGVLSKFKMNYVLTLPFKPEKHNAVIEKDGGRTLEWHITPGENKLMMQATVLNKGNIIASIIGVILLLVLFLVRRRKFQTDYQ